RCTLTRPTPMKPARLALPLAPADAPGGRRLQVHAPVEPALRALPRVERVVRKGVVLHAGPVGAGGEVLSLNLATGCAHRCAFCSARASPRYPGDELVYLHAATADRLHAELSGVLTKPRAVYVSPSTDPFPPLSEVQREAARVVSVLAAHGVEAWLMTRGF